MDARRFAPATSRNREPILDVLAPLGLAGARVLEIASGTGEHAVFLAGRLGVASWQPSDADAGARESIDAWRTFTDDPCVTPALALDVTSRPWPVPEGARFDLLVNVNMIHISPWSACEALFDGARDVLAPGALCYLYGPFRRGGAMARSNEAFDASLRARDPAWGVRDLEQVVAVARARGFDDPDVTPMPAENLSLVFRFRASEGSTAC